MKTSGDVETAVFTNRRSSRVTVGSRRHSEVGSLAEDELAEVLETAGAGTDLATAVQPSAGLRS